MSFARTLRAAFAVSLALPVLLSACREDAIIGTDLAPIDDSINTVSVDSRLGISARSVYDDTVITAFLEDGGSLVGVAQGIGAVSNDPYGGRVTAGLYFSVVPPSGGFSFDTTGLKIDSVILVLPYAGAAWGDTSNSTPGQRWSVFQVTEDLVQDSFYRSNQSRSISTRLASALVYRNDYAMPRSVDGATRPAHLRMRLDTVEMSRILRGTGGNLGSAAGMRGLLKGFYIAPDAGQTAAMLAYFRFSASTGLYERPAMLLYYQTPGRTSSLAVFPFSVDSSAAFTRVERLYGGSPAFTLLFSGNESLIPKDQLLLQNEPGAAIDVKLGGLSKLPKAIYPKAQIILTKLDTAQSDKFVEPPRIFPSGVKPGGSTYTILDREPLGSTAPLSFIDGTRRSVSIGGVTVTQYIVNVPRELQRAVFAGEDTLHLRLNGAAPLLSGASRLPGAYRLIAGGTAHGRWNIRASVAYSRQ